MRSVLPCNLEMVNELYDNWATHESGILQAGEKKTVRRAVYAEAQKTFSTGHAILAATHPNSPYELYHFMFPVDHDHVESEFKQPEHWSWMASRLCEALRTAPHAVALKVAHVLFRDAGSPGAPRWILSRETLVGIFGSQASEVMDRIRCDVPELSEQEAEFMRQVRAEADSFLASTANIADITMGPAPNS
jgi:hypothetical protein